VLNFPRQWVLGTLIEEASKILDLSDSWEYRRLLELADLIDQELVQQIVKLGFSSKDEEVREAAEDYRVKD
jgi:hypothetical protein